MQEFEEVSKDVLHEIEIFVQGIKEIMPKGKVSNEILFVYFELICQLIGLHLKEVFAEERFKLLKEQTEAMEQRDLNGCLQALKNPSLLLQQAQQKKKLH